MCKKLIICLLLWHSCSDLHNLLDINLVLSLKACYQAVKKKEESSPGNPSDFDRFSMPYLSSSIIYCARQILSKGPIDFTPVLDKVLWFLFPSNLIGG